MSDCSTIFDDIMQGLHEIEEYQNGNIELKRSEITILDEEIEAISKFKKLSDTNKHIAIVLINELYEATNQ